MDNESKKLQNEILYYTRLLENHKKNGTTIQVPPTRHYTFRQNEKQPYSYKNQKNLSLQPQFSKDSSQNKNQYKWKSKPTPQLSTTMQQQQKLQQQRLQQQQKQQQLKVQQKKIEQQKKLQDQKVQEQRVLQQQKKLQQKKLQAQKIPLPLPTMSYQSSSSESMSSVTPVTPQRKGYLWSNKYIKSTAIAKTPVKFVSPAKRTLKRFQPGRNISKNKYKVVRKQSKTSSNPSTPSSSDISQDSFQAKKFRKYSTCTQRSQYKFVQSRVPVKPIQTRSSKTGNIVLKRNICKNRSINKVNSMSTYKQATPRHHPSIKQKLASHAVQKSLQTMRKNRHKLKRTYCIYYNRFGKCKRGDKCQFTHDPDRVALCTQFLRGTCRKEKCPFSHKISKEKMPICQFFVRGKCSTKDCPYLHVFVGHNAPVCRPFATTGYCPRADNCKQKHLRVCPEFYEVGKCKRGNSCDLPHKQPTRKRTKSASKKDIKNEPLKLKPRTSVQSKKELESGFIRLLPKSRILKSKKTPSPRASNLQVVESKVQIQPRLKTRKTKVN